MGEAGLIKRVLGLLVFVSIAGCAAPPPAPEAPRSSPTPSPVAPPRSTAPSRDLCKAGDHQHLVGRPRTEVPVPVHPALQRVACTTCPVTQDHNPYRLNFFFDADTGLIRQVRCG